MRRDQHSWRKSRRSLWTRRLPSSLRLLKNQMRQLRVRVKKLKLVQLQRKERIRKRNSLQRLQQERMEGHLQQLVLLRQARQILCQQLQLSQSISVSL